MGSRSSNLAAPAPGAAPTPAASRSSAGAVPQELRLGLAMNGGIALVLYQAGVSHEVLQFVRALEQPNPAKSYADALGDAGISPVLDVVTGASAGGIACVMLGHCMATGGDFNGFHDVWIKEADVYGMRYPKGGAPKSLLDTEQLIGKVRKIFRQQAAAAKSNTGASEPDLFVRLCRTDFYGTCLSTKDALGHKVDVQTQSSVVALDGSRFVTWDPVVSDDKIERLLNVAQETSAFPGAWPAVQDKRNSRWYIDGGLWNNQPLDLAVDAVKDKAAFFDTHRALLLVQPDPVQVASDTLREEPALGSVLSTIPLMGLNGNLWPAVQGVLNNNQRADLYNALVGALTGPKDTSRSSPGSVDALKNIGSGAHALARQQLDEADRYDGSAPIHLFNVIRIHDLLFDNDPWLIQRWNVSLDLLDRHFGEEGLGTLARRSALQALGSLEEFDLQRRAARRQLDELNAAIRKARASADGIVVITEPKPSQPEVTGSDKAAPDHPSVTLEEQQVSLTDQEVAIRKMILYAQIEAIEDFLFLQMDTAELAQQDDTAFHPELRRHSAFRPRAVAMLTQLDATLSGFSLASRSGDSEAASAAVIAIPSILGAWAKGVIEDSQPNPITFYKFGSPVQRIETLRAVKVFRRQASQSMGKMSQIDQNRAVEEALKQLQDENWPVVDDIDYVRHILGAVSDLTGKKPIDLVRISPNDTNNLHLINETNEEGTPASAVKLAGEGLGHFQGFLEERWRRNDYIWARLDTAEILLRTLQRAANSGATEFLPEDRYEALLEERQKEILREEAGLAGPKTVGVTVGPGFSAENRKLIGFGGESIADATEPRFSENLRYLFQTAIQLLRGDDKKPPAALTVLERVMRVLSYVAQTVTFFAPPGRRKAGNVLVASFAVIGALLCAFAAGYLTGGQYMPALIQGTLASLALIALGCLLGWRWYHAVFVALAVAYTACFVLFDKLRPGLVELPSWLQWLRQATPNAAHPSWLTAGLFGVWGLVGVSVLLSVLKWVWGLASSALKRRRMRTE